MRHRPSRSERTPASRPRSAIWVYVGVAAITFLTFLPSLHCEFVNWDDEANLVTNPDYRGLSPHHLKWMFTTLHMGPYQPLSWLTLAVDYLLWGLQPMGYHLTNILLHAAAAGLFAAAAARLVTLAPAADSLDTSPSAESRPAPTSNNVWFGAATALIWSVHPMRVEGVTWVTERREVLCGALTLLAILLYLRKGAGWPVTAAGAAAMLAKGTAMVLPAILILIDLYSERPPTRAHLASAFFRSLRRNALLIVLALAAAFIAVKGQQRSDTMLSWTRVPPLARVGILLHGLGFYFVKTVWPSRLAPLYESPVDFYESDLPLDFSFLLPSALACAAGLLALDLLAWRFRRRAPALLPLMIAYILLAVPTGGLAQSGQQLAADRYAYQPGLVLSLGLVLALTWVTSRGAGPNRMIAMPVACVAVLSALILLCVRQQGFWQSSTTLWERQLTVDPTSAIGHHNIGASLIQSRGAPMYARAEQHFRDALRKFPNHSTSEAQLGMVLRREGRLAEAADSLRRALRGTTNDLSCVLALACVSWKLDRRAEAIELLRALLRGDPKGADAHLLLARALAADGRTREAIKVYEKGIADCPKTDKGWILPTDLAMLLATHPDPVIRNGPRAVELLLQSRSLAPRIDGPMAQALAAAYAAKGDFDGALLVLDEGQRVLPPADTASFQAMREKFLRREPLFASPQFSEYWGEFEIQYASSWVVRR